MLRVLLAEKLSGESLEITWKFPSGNEPGCAELLKQRLEFLWRELPSECSHVSRTKAVWQCVYFGSNFGVVLECSSRPSVELHRIVASLAFAFEKSRDVTAIASTFLKHKMTPQPISDDGTSAEPLEVELQNILPQLTQENLKRLASCIGRGGRICLSNGPSSHLYRIANRIARLHLIEVHPLILGPFEQELEELQELGSFVCCHPSENLFETRSKHMFWDVNIDLTSGDTTFRALSQV